MIQQLLTYGNTFCSIEHSIDKNAKEHFLVLQLKKTKRISNSRLKKFSKTRGSFYSFTISKTCFFNCQ